MQTYNTKEKLINLYKKDYEQKYYKSCLELSLTKLGNLSDTNPVKLKEDQRLNIQRVLNEENIIQVSKGEYDSNLFNKDSFLEGLNILTHEQLCYVGW